MFLSMVCVIFVLLWGFGGCSTDQERINHMPVCEDLAGNQMRQNYDGLLVKAFNVRR